MSGQEVTPRSSAVTEATFRSFGYEWTRFHRVWPEDEGYWHRYFADVDLDALRGRVGLDAGCGQGRYSLYTARHLDALIALDGSDAVRAAAVNLGRCPTAAVVRADLRRCPLAAGSFGFISCLGVLHHLENPREGFDALVDLLAPGGILLVYLYSRARGVGVRSIGLGVAAGLRRLTVRMPDPLLRLLSWPVALTLWLLVVWPGAVLAGRRRKDGADPPLAAYRRRPLRYLWLDTFDRLSSPVSHRYVWEDIRPWYDDAGLVVEAVRDESGLFIVARRPDDPAS